VRVKARHVVERVEPAVLPFPGADSFGIAAGATGVSLNELEQFASERAEAPRTAGFRACAPARACPSGRVERSDASVWRTILDVADEVDAETVVVGARGLSTVASALLGSVSNAVVHHSGRPVLVIPRGSR
jgi:nucleotide-binding universal stress UspA family protein